MIRRIGEVAGLVSESFLQGMVDRMVVSYHKYGHVKDAFPSKMVAADQVRHRLRAYQRTGNTEFLMDAANYCMIEFMHPAHPNAHFRATDSHESPGRVLPDGSVETRAPDAV